jgi:hypothetical protein
MTVQMTIAPPTQAATTTMAMIVLRVRWPLLPFDAPPEVPAVSLGEAAAWFWVGMMVEVAMTTAFEVAEEGGGVVEDEGREEVEVWESVELADAGAEAEGAADPPSKGALRIGRPPGCLVGVA